MNVLALLHSVLLTLRVRTTITYTVFATFSYMFGTMSVMLVHGGESPNTMLLSSRLIIASLQSRHID